MLAIPYDYAAELRLLGEAGNLVEGVISTSVDGVFVAHAIGYGFEPESAFARITPLTAQAGSTNFAPWKVPLAELPPQALVSGFRLNPDVETALYREVDPSAGGAPRRVQRIPEDEKIAPGYRSRLIERVAAPPELSFLFGMVDTSTGRELQDEPTHNLASLGKSNGERPFRRLARPMSFQPRSTIRIQVTELSRESRGVLFVALHGYRILDLGACPEEMTRTLRSLSAVTKDGGGAEGRVIPFDQVASVTLTGRPGNRIVEEVPVNVDGAFVATSLGYGLQRGDSDVTLSVTGPTVDLKGVRLADFSDDALREGIRVRPELIRFAFQSDGSLSGGLSPELARNVFERLGQPERVSFRYSIFDTGTGRELQNRMLNNVAGLGIADGDRPFKAFARPMIFLPRSTIRVEVEERFGRGRLFLVFQGYKVLGGRRAA